MPNWHEAFVCRRCEMPETKRHPVISVPSVIHHEPIHTFAHSPSQHLLKMANIRSGYYLFRHTFFVEKCASLFDDVLHLIILFSSMMRPSRIAKSTWGISGWWFKSMTIVSITQPHLDALDEKLMWQGFCQGQKWIYDDTITVTQLSNLWWVPNSVSIGFGPAMKTGSSRRFKRYPTTYMWVSSQLPFTVD